MIRTALLWLAIGYSLGGLVLLTKGLSLWPWLWALRTGHIHILLVGWTVQLACGVAFWILPRLDARGSRGDERLVWGCYVALNGGVVCGALHDPLVALAAWSGWWALLPLMGLLYVVAAVLFALHAWPRVVSFRVLPRPARD